MVPPAEYEKNVHLAAELEALSGDQRPSPVNGKVITSTDRGPEGPAEADRPALLVGAPTGLEQAQ